LKSIIYTAQSRKRDHATLGAPPLGLSNLAVATQRILVRTVVRGVRCVNRPFSIELAIIHKSGRQADELSPIYACLGTHGMVCAQQPQHGEVVSRPG
jgi:hypothetical protein